MSATPILADARWIGPHGIGRFAANVLSRLPAHSQLRSGPRHLSFLDPIWLSYQIARHRPGVFFSPGFSLPAVSRAPLVFTIYDLIPIQLPTAPLAYSRARKLYFHAIVRQAARRAYRVLTVSE
ncbi:MAG: glycosyltransferase family 4 protein, partial [Bryobacteraceae bacterium]